MRSVTRGLSGDILGTGLFVPKVELILRVKPEDLYKAIGAGALAYDFTVDGPFPRERIALPIPDLSDIGGTVDAKGYANIEVRFLWSSNTLQKGHTLTITPNFPTMEGQAAVPPKEYFRLLDQDEPIVFTYNDKGVAPKPEGEAGGSEFPWLAVAVVALGVVVIGYAYTMSMSGEKGKQS